jgi:Spy/CpxP family protein refolding chaperone
MTVIQKTRMAAITAAVGMAMGLGTAALAQPHGDAGGEHRGMRGGFHGLRQLGLSDEQRQEVRRIMELHKAERQAIGERLREARRAQSEAVMAVPVDESAVRARSAELAKVESDAAVLRSTTSSPRSSRRRRRPCGRNAKPVVRSTVSGGRASGRTSRRSRRWEREAGVCWSRASAQTSRTPWLRTRKYPATQISRMPLITRAVGAEVKSAIFPLMRLPSGMPPRNASM